MPAFKTINTSPTQTSNDVRRHSSAEIKAKMSINNLIQYIPVDREPCLRHVAALGLLSLAESSKSIRPTSAHASEHTEPLSPAGPSSLRKSSINTPAQVPDNQIESSSAKFSQKVKGRKRKSRGYQDKETDDKNNMVEKITAKEKRVASSYQPDKFFDEVKKGYNTPAYRYVKNMSFWLEDLAIGQNDDLKWDWRTMEEMADELLPYKNAHLDIPDKVEVSKILNYKSNSLSTAVLASSSHQDAGVGLHETEREVCRQAGLPHDKYRMIRAALLIGFACIYEQNNRGLSRYVCRQHPSMAKGKYIPINAGASQAQCIVPKVDVNTLSGVFQIFQTWNWFPAPVSVGSDGNKVCTPGIDQKYPISIRERLIRAYGNWEQSRLMTSNFRMTIGREEWFRYSNPGTGECRRLGCRCPQALESAPAVKRRKVSV